jgi:hypothetical protein
MTKPTSLQTAPLEKLTEEEAYLWAIFQDPVDLAEFSWFDATNEENGNFFRCYDYQFAWWRYPDHYTIDFSARSVGKTLGIQLRMFQFPFILPEREAVITASTQAQVDRVTNAIEYRFDNQRLGREMIMAPPVHRPFVLKMKNGAKIMGIIPRGDGSGLRGVHPTILEMDEAQDMPEQAWSEATETVSRKEKRAAWHCHGVTTGVGNEFYRQSKHAMDETELRPVSHDLEGLFTIHHIPAMADPFFTPQERKRKMNTYPEESEWRRNVRGLPGDALSPLFRPAAVRRSIEDDLSAEYNREIYWHRTINNFDLNATQTDIVTLLAKPQEHTDPRFTVIWAGMDIGLSNDPTEILLFAEYHLEGEEKKAMLARKDKAFPKNNQSRLMCIGRISLKGVHAPAQGDLIMWLCENYDIQRFTMDSTGIGLPMFQYIQREQATPGSDKAHAARRALASIIGYNFKQKILVAFDDRIEVDSRLIDDKVKEQGILREVKPWSTDMIRLYLEEQRLWLPWDIDFITQLEASKFTFKRGQFDDYGRRVQMFTTGDDHCLDALRMAVLGHAQMTIDTMVAAPQKAVFEQIISADDFGAFRGDYDPYGW